MHFAEQWRRQKPTENGSSSNDGSHNGHSRKNFDTNTRTQAQRWSGHILQNRCCKTVSARNSHLFMVVGVWDLWTSFFIRWKTRSNDGWSNLWRASALTKNKFSFETDEPRNVHLAAAAAVAVVLCSPLSMAFVAVLQAACLSSRGQFIEFHKLRLHSSFHEKPKCQQ